MVRPEKSCFRCGVDKDAAKSRFCLEDGRTFGIELVNVMERDRHSWWPKPIPKLKLTLEDQRTFAATIANPPEPNKPLREALEAYVTPPKEPK